MRELCNTNVTKFKLSFIQFKNNDNINNDKESSNNISFCAEMESENFSENKTKKNEYDFFV